MDIRLILGYFPSGSAKHVQQAVNAAKKAFESWGKTHYKKRIDICRQLQRL
jgi:acyl-CoA reductase-like NAD-dependent aldehyde dehydrogenase